MKKIEAIIRRHKLDDVKAALSEAGVEGMTIHEVRGFGRQQGRWESYRGLEYAVDFTPRIKVEVVVVDQSLPVVMQAIVTGARTGETGDGMIYVSTPVDVVRVRTGETAEAAISAMTRNSRNGT